MKYLFLSPTDPHIKVFGKGDKWREVGLGEKSRGELSRFIGKYRTGEKGSESFVFRTRRNAPLTEETLFRTIKQLGNQANIKSVRCSPHTLRHTYSVMFIRAGGDIYKLSKLLGHTSVRMTENYLSSFNQADARRGAISPADQIF